MRGRVSTPLSRENSFLLAPWLINFGNWDVEPTGCLSLRLERRSLKGHAMVVQEQRIRARAYRIWEEEGRPEGRAEVHWDMARELIAIEDNFQDTLKPAPPMGADDRAGEPVEEAVANVTGELPTMTDQDEQRYPPSREAAKKGTAKKGTRGSP